MNAKEYYRYALVLLVIMTEACGAPFAAPEGTLVLEEEETLVTSGTGLAVDDRTVPDAVGSETITCTYHANGRVSSISRQGNSFGCGILMGEETYDTLGRLITHVICSHELPVGSESCHDIHTVITTLTYAQDGILLSREQQEQFYESEAFDCGTWEYFDKTGSCIRTEVHKPCDDAVLDRLVR